MKKNLITLALASAIGLAGCGGSDGGSSDKDTDSEVQTFTTLSGVVNKGIVKGAKVEVCETFDDMGCDSTEGYYYATVTDENGAYNSDANAPKDVPLMVLVTKQTGTQMKCDVETCDTDIEFGDWFDVANDWSLRAILSEASTSAKTVNVTSLTDIAAIKVIELTDGFVSKELIVNTTEAVKEAFGITDDLTEIGGVDLTDPIAVAAADTKELKAATLSAALMGKTDDEKKALVTLDQATGGFTIATTEIDAIKVQAKTVVTEIEDELSDLGTDISFTDLEQALDESTPVSTDPVIPPSTQKLAVQEFVKDIRTVVESAEEEGRLSSGLSTFGEELELIGDVVSDDFDAAIEAAVKVIMFSADAAAENIEQANEETPEYLVKAIDFDGDSIAESSITQNDDGSESHTLINYVTEDEVTVNLTAKVSKQYLEQSETGTNCDWDKDDGNIDCVETIEAGIDFDISSLVATKTTGGVVTTLTITDGAAVVTDGAGSFDEKETTTSTSNSESLDGESLSSISVANVLLHFPNFTLETAGRQNDIELDGSFRLNIEDFAYAEDEEWMEESTVDTNDQYNYEETDTSTETITVSRADLEIEGEISLGDESIAAALDIRLENNGYTHSISFSEQWGSMGNSFTEEESSESASSFVKAYAVASLSTNVASASQVPVDTTITLDVARESFDVVDAELTVEYDDIRAIFDTQFGLYDNHIRQDVTIKDGHGIVVDFTDVEENAEAVVRVNGAKAATISDNDGMSIIRYNDGTFESIF